MSWDEPFQRILGVLTDTYLHGTSQGLLEAENRYHGQFYNYFQIRMEYLFVGGNDLSGAFYVDHLVNFLLFYASVFVFFLLGTKPSKIGRPGC